MHLNADYFFLFPFFYKKKKRFVGSIGDYQCMNLDETYNKKPFFLSPLCVTFTVFLGRAFVSIESGLPLLYI